MDKYERLVHLLTTIRRANMPNRLALYDNIVDIEIIYKDAMEKNSPIHWKPGEVEVLQLESKVRKLKEDTDLLSSTATKLKLEIGDLWKRMMRTGH